MNAFRRHLSHVFKKLKQILPSDEQAEHRQEILSSLGFKGELSVDIFRNNKQIDHVYVPNIVLDQGKTEIMLILTSDVLRETSGSVRSICRLAIGDGGATGSAYNIPKARDKTRSGLFYEVHRKDIDSFTRPDPNKVTFVTEVLSSNLSLPDFNPAMGDAYINEAGLVSSLPATYVDGPPSGIGVVGPDDVLVTHTTFPSIPFQPALGLTARFRWTLTAVL